ncbi:MAG: hypothetical protein ABIG28_02490 [archaeon]
MKKIRDDENRQKYSLIQQEKIDYSVRPQVCDVNYDGHKDIVL